MTKNTKPYYQWTHEEKDKEGSKAMLMGLVVIPISALVGFFLGTFLVDEIIKFLGGEAIYTLGCLTIWLIVGYVVFEVFRRVMIKFGLTD